MGSKDGAGAVTDASECHSTYPPEGSSPPPLPSPPSKTVPPLSVKLEPDVKTLLRLQSAQNVLLIGFPRH